MKYALILLVFLGGVANADVVTLYESGCANTRTCVDVENDAGLNIAIYDQVSTPAGANHAVYVIIDNVRFYAPYGAGASIVDLSLFDDQGRQIVLDASFTGYRHYVGGRGGHWVTTWTLTTGTITRPYIEGGGCRGCH